MWRRDSAWAQTFLAEVAPVKFIHNIFIISIYSHHTFREPCVKTQWNRPHQHHHPHNHLAKQKPPMIILHGITDITHLYNVSMDLHII